MASHPASQPYAVPAVATAQEYSLGRFNPASNIARFEAHKKSPQSLKVPVVNDYIAQPTGEFKMSFSAVSVPAEDYPATCSYALNVAPTDKNMGTGYILDNEDATVEIQDGQFAEGTDIKLPVQFSHDIGFVTASVNWASDDNQSGTIQFPAGGGANMRSMLTASSEKTDCVDYSSVTKFTLDSLTSQPGKILDMSISDDAGQAFLLNTDRATINVMSVERQSQDNGKYELKLQLDGCVSEDVVVDLRIEEPDKLPSGITDETRDGLKVTLENDGDTKTVAILSGSSFESASFKVVFGIDSPEVALSQYIDYDFQGYNGDYVSETSDNGVISVSGGDYVDAGSAATFTVALSKATHKYDITYDYTTADGSATVVDGDYNRLAGTSTWEKFNNESHVYEVATSTSDIISLDKDFQFIVSNAKDESGASVLYGTCEVNANTGCAAKATIQNGLRGKVSFVQDSYIAQEGSEVTFTVQLDQKAAFSFSVLFAFTDDSAKQGVNYHTPSVNLNFAPEDQEVGYAVQTVNDNVVNVRALEFKVKIDSLTDAQGLISIDETKSEATGMIESADTAKVKFSETQFISKSGKVTFTIELLHALDTPVIVNFTTSDNTAEATVDYTPVETSVVWPEFELGKKTVVVESKVDPNWVSPELHFDAALSTENSFVEFVEPIARGILPSQGEVAFTAVTNGLVTEGDVFSMVLEMVHPVRKIPVSVDLETEPMINDVDAAVAGMDYHPAESTVGWDMSNGVILAKALSRTFTMTTIINTDLTSKKLWVAVNSVNSGSLPVQPASASLKVQVTISSSAKGIKTTSYNCKNPIKYQEKIGDGPTQTHGSVTLGYNYNPIGENDIFMGVKVDVKDCFDTAGDGISYTATQGNINVPVTTGGLIELNNLTLQFPPNEVSVELQVVASSGQTSSSPLTITVSVSPLNDFFLSDLVGSGVKLGVFDYFSGWVKQVPVNTLANVNGLTCEYRSAYSKSLVTNGAFQCCEERKAGDIKILMTESCFVVMPEIYEDPLSRSMQIQFQALHPGRSKFCLGSVISTAEEQCFTVTVPDTLNIPKIPDQYVIAAEGWAVEVDFELYGYRPQDDNLSIKSILQEKEHALTIEPQGSGVVKISGEAGSAGKVFELSAVITTAANTFEFKNNEHQSTGIQFHIVTI
jgi:hypothetical protein